MASTSNKNTHKSSHIPGWVWLFIGTALGAFIMFLVQLSDPRESGQKSSTSKAPNQSDNADIQFDFYEILKNAKVDVGSSKPKSNTSTGTGTGNTVKDNDNTEYLLQVASFKSMQDAEQLRAELILLNLPAMTEVANIRNGEKWHRVIVGPYISHSKLASARSKLISNKFEALVLKRAQ